MVRRRSKTPQGEIWDGAVPFELVVFDPDDWPGDRLLDQWNDWWTTGIEWSEVNLPGGHDGLWAAMLEHYEGDVPGAPWDEAAI
ncbi:hypothetical protein GCM10025784_11740 [Citricoccus nitrophenolicus]